MELSTTREATSCAATQEISRFLWNAYFHYRVYKSSPLVPILSPINPVRGIHTSFLQALPLITYMRSSSAPTYPANLILLDLIVLIILGKSSSHEATRMQFSPPSCHFIFLLSRVSPQHPVFKHLRSMLLP
jgi:hypothetical protein